ncbi:DUF1778 domain-containing protein [Aeromonas sp. DNP9]|uniref:type II toxin-antitoxin system TacA family antitoxin n=1 Tax=Aeromonas sp. DNP9 TaxID=1535548 RepID=UPI0009F4DD6D|nr:DUF1778 domain-containing protein [Aeromonas sp. DNP9]
MKNLSVLSANPLDLPKNSRIELKTNSEIKEILRQAATSSGIDMTAFIVQAAAEKARKVLLESQVFFLSSPMFDKVSEAINVASEPTASLIELLTTEECLFDDRHSKHRRQCKPKPTAESV